MAQTNVCMSSLHLRTRIYNSHHTLYFSKRLMTGCTHIFLLNFSLGRASSISNCHKLVVLKIFYRHLLYFSSYVSQLLPHTSKIYHKNVKMHQILYLSKHSFSILLTGSEDFELNLTQWAITKEKSLLICLKTAFPRYTLRQSMGAQVIASIVLPFGSTIQISCVVIKYSFCSRFYVFLCEIIIFQIIM